MCDQEFNGCVDARLFGKRRGVSIRRIGNWLSSSVRPSGPHVPSHDRSIPSTVINWETRGAQGSRWVAAVSARDQADD